MVVVLCRDGDLAIRRLRNEPGDLALLVRWRAQPHVHEWWDPDFPAPTFDEVAAEYGSETDPERPTTPCLIELDGRPIGYVQFYRWADEDADDATEMGIEIDDGTWGLDVLIGEPELIGRGLGSRAVDLLCRYLEGERGATSVALATEVGNDRARRAYEKSGFHAVKQVLDLDTRGGERLSSWLMVRRRGVPGPGRSS
jgi:aminoglycoside 6'-N-acetyltransferase